MAELNELRKFLLGNDLFNQCKSGVTNNEDLQNRLDWLKERGFLLRSDLNDLVYLCGLKTINMLDPKWQKFIVKNNPKVEDKVQTILSNLIYETKNFNSKLDTELINLKNSIKTDPENVPHIDFESPNFCDLIDYFSSIDRNLYNKFLDNLGYKKKDQVLNCYNLEPSKQVVKSNMIDLKTGSWKSRSSYCTDLNTTYKEDCNDFKKYEGIEDIKDIKNIHNNWKKFNKSTNHMSHSLDLLNKCIDGRENFTNKCIFPDSNQGHKEAINILKQARFDCQNVFDDAKENEEKIKKIKKSFIQKIKEEEKIPIVEVELEEEQSEDQLKEEQSEVQSKEEQSEVQSKEEKQIEPEIEVNSEIVSDDEEKQVESISEQVKKSKKSKKKKVEKKVEKKEEKKDKSIIERESKVQKLSRLIDDRYTFNLSKQYVYNKNKDRLSINFLSDNSISIYVDKYFNNFKNEFEAINNFIFFLNLLFETNFVDFLLILVNVFKIKDKIFLKINNKYLYDDEGITEEQMQKKSAVDVERRKQVAEFIQKIWDPKITKLFTLEDDTKVNKFLVYVDQILTKNPFANSHNYPSFSLYSLVNYISSVRELEYTNFSDFLLNLISFDETINIFKTIKENVLKIKLDNSEKIITDPTEFEEFKKNLNVLRIEIVTTKNQIESYLVLTYKPTHEDGCDYEYYIKDKYICNAIRQVFWEKITKFLSSPVAYLFSITFFEFISGEQSKSSIVFSTILQVAYTIAEFTDCNLLTKFFPSIRDIKRMKKALSEFITNLVDKYKNKNIHQNYTIENQPKIFQSLKPNINNTLLQYLYNNQHCVISKRYNPQLWLFKDTYWFGSIFLTFYLWLVQVTEPPFDIKNVELEYVSKYNNLLDANCKKIVELKEITPAMKYIEIPERSMF